MKEPKYCACGCGSVLSRMNRSGFSRGHIQKTEDGRRKLVVERAAAEAERRLHPVAEPTPEPEPWPEDERVDRFVMVGEEKAMVLACRRHNTWIAWNVGNGRKPPAPDTLHDRCPDCTELRRATGITGEGSDQVERYGRSVGFSSPVRDDVMADWRRAQEQLRGPRPGSLEEDEALAVIDQARDEAIQRDRNPRTYVTANSAAEASRIRKRRELARRPQNGGYR